MLLFRTASPFCSSLLDRIVGLILRLVELVDGEGERRDLLRELVGGAMELLLGRRGSHPMGKW